MRWFARPEHHILQLKDAPRLASWDKADHPDQIRLRKYLETTETLLGGSRIGGPWALRLDVGLPSGRDLLDAADLDNYAYPLAYRLRDSNLVSVWCTKEHSERSFVRIEAAREVPQPRGGVLVARTASTATLKEQIRTAVAEQPELPSGPVRLELSFVVGPRRNWLQIWKPTIDSLDRLLGRTYPDRDWHPRDGRITELGLHVAVDPTEHNAITVGIFASPALTGNIAKGMEAAAINDNSTANADVQAGKSIEGSVDVAVEFRNEEADYLTWLAAHPEGYVLNITRSHAPAGARLHRAKCRTVNGQYPHRGPLVGQYVKVCADALGHLERWVASNISVTVPGCNICSPQ